LIAGRSCETIPAAAINVFLPELPRADALPELPDQALLDDRLRTRVPLVVGVTGHVDLPASSIDDLEARVSRVFDRLKNDYLPDNDSTPIIVLSALAEGADRLVADVALKRGFFLIAPLPMKEADYRADFKTPESDAAFVRLRDATLGHFVVPHPTDMPDAPPPDVSVQAERDKRYEAVGLYIVRNCHVLIALWNGDKTEKKGGTAQLVRFKREGIPIDLSHSTRAALDGSEVGPVIHVVTPRIKDGPGAVSVATKPWGTEVTGRPGLFRRFFRSIGSFALRVVGKPHAEPDPKLRTWQVFAAITKQTYRFNTEVSELPQPEPGGIDPGQSLAWLFEDTAKRAIAAARSGALESAPHWCGLYQHADAVAQWRQRIFMRDWQFLFGVGFLALVVFEVFAHLLPECTALLVIYALIFFSVFAWFYYARRQEHQERFLDYRALAEALRVAVYWKLAGIGVSVADAYPIKQPSELAWVKIVLRALDMLHLAKPPRAIAVTPHSLEMARDLWVEGQRAYFKRQGDRHDRIAEMREAQSLLALGLSPVTGIVLALLMQGHAVSHLGHHLLIILMGLFAGLAAVIAGYVEKLAHHAHARQYDRMRMLFSQASTLIDGASRQGSIDPALVGKIEALYIELGGEAMKENADWVAIFRQRPIRPAG